MTDDRRQRAREFIEREGFAQVSFMDSRTLERLLLAFADAEAGREKKRRESDEHPAKLQALDSQGLTQEQLASASRHQVGSKASAPRKDAAGEAGLTASRYEASFDPPSTARQLAEAATARLPIETWTHPNHPNIATDIIEAAILDGRKAAFEELHAWLDNQGVTRTVPCADGSDDAVLWLVTRIRLYAKANPMPETAVWAGEAKKQAEARHDAEARLASVTAELKSQQTWINRITDNTNAMKAMQVQLSKAEAKLAELIAERDTECHCGLSPEHEEEWTLSCPVKLHRENAVKTWQHIVLELHDVVSRYEIKLARVTAFVQHRFGCTFELAGCTCTCGLEAALKGDGCE